MIGWGAHFQVSGLSHQVSGTGPQVQVRVQEICPLSSVICHRSSHRLIPGGGWQPRVAGGGTIPFSPPFSPQGSPPLSPPWL